MHLLIAPNGSARCLYTEAMDLAALGRLTITRASYVEPGLSSQGWFADLRPVSGPSLGPFRFRSEALAAERDWLEAHLLGAAHEATALRDRPAHPAGPHPEPSSALHRLPILHCALPEV